MNRAIVAILLSLCVLTGRAQQPLLTTHWTQGSPYNQHCPADPLANNNHSYAGCPAVAMGQILNYLRTTQGTRFDDGDDYYTGNYFGRQFHIDDDWSTYSFPSFPQLNVMLDSADARFQRGAELTNSLKAAIVFACGVACQQVYSASDSYGSGTYSVDQAFAAYQRFGFADCQLFRTPDSAMYAILVSNLQAGYPAHLAVESQDGMSGHNVVVDGYRESDGKFHLNFGYGGYMDDWYDIPDPDFYYGMTQLEGIIMNLIPAVHSAVPEAFNNSPKTLEIYPNPASDIIYLKSVPDEQVEYSIINVLGQVVATGSTCGSISVTGLEQGLYFLQIEWGSGLKTAKFIVE